MPSLEAQGIFDIDRPNPGKTAWEWDWDGFEIIELVNDPRFNARIRNLVSGEVALARVLRPILGARTHSDPLPDDWDAPVSPLDGNAD